MSGAERGKGQERAKTGRGDRSKRSRDILITWLPCLCVNVILTIEIQLFSFASKY